jgi:hypothetical protein
MICNLTRINGTLHEDQYTFLIISRSFLIIMRKVSDESCRESQNTHFRFNNYFSKIVPFMGQCGRNIVKPERPQMTIWGMRTACWIPKATNTQHMWYLLFFLLQQSDSMLHCYIACLFYNLKERPNSVVLSTVAGFLLKGFNSRNHAFLTEANGELISTCWIQ